MIMSIPLKREIYSSIGNETMELTGDVTNDIAAICENLRLCLYAEVEAVKLEALEHSEEYTRLGFDPGSIHSASLEITFVASRQETKEEIVLRLAREDREEKARLARKEKTDKAKEVRNALTKKKELATLRSLATKHGMTISEEKNDV